MKTFVNIILAFIANAQATKLMQPAQRSFHDPTIPPEPTPMRGVPLGQDGLNPETTQDLVMRLGIISTVALHALGSTARMADLAPCWRDF